MSKIKITVAGKVSAGKSSFINTFHYTICDYKNTWTPICSVSLQRETFVATEYILEGKINNNIKFLDSSEIRKTKLPELTLKKIETGMVKGNIYSISDFPGIDDSNDNRKCFEFLLENMGDITIFVAAADRPFVDKSECEYFEKLCKKSEELNKSGIYNKIIILINKFDYADDNDLDEMYNAVVYKYNNYGIYRWCSYAQIKNIKNIDIKEKRKAAGVQNVWDHDNLIYFITNLDINLLRSSIRFEYELGYFNKTGMILSDNFQTYKVKVKNESMEFSEYIAYKYFTANVYYELPIWAYHEKYLAQSWEKTESYDRFMKLKKIDNLQPYVSIIKQLYDNNKTIDNMYFMELYAWKNRYYYELAEAYSKYQGLKILIDVPKFPIDAIEYFKLNKEVLIQRMYISLSLKITSNTVTFW